MDKVNINLITISERVAIAKESEAAVLSNRVIKKEWLRAARLSFCPGEKEECAVCGKYKSIAHAHHIVPLSWQYDNGNLEPSHEHAWLCPNHHALAHQYISHVHDSSFSPDGFSHSENELIQRVLLVFGDAVIQGFKQ